MRDPREKDPPDETDAYYHLFTRAVAGDFLFGNVEKEVLRKNVWRVAERCGMEVITFSVLDNHVHIVVYAPRRIPLSDGELLRRYALLHAGGSDHEKKRLGEIRLMLASGGDAAEHWRAREMRNMSDISAYMKLLKQRYSIWYNQSHKRFGTLWAERFGSVLLERGAVVQRIAAYVDLNPVRAGLCRDPKDYRFCGYAEALAGERRAQNGIMRALEATTWEEAQRRYRVMLFLRAARPSRKGASISARERDDVLAQQGNVTRAEQLRCRCKYFTSGGVLGSKAFVMERLRRFRKLTGRGERMEPRPGEGAASGWLALHRPRLAPAIP